MNRYRGNEFDNRGGVETIILTKVDGFYYVAFDLLRSDHAVISPANHNFSKIPWWKNIWRSMAVIEPTPHVVTVANYFNQVQSQMATSPYKSLVVEVYYRVE